MLCPPFPWRDLERANSIYRIQRISSQLQSRPQSVPMSLTPADNTIIAEAFDSPDDCETSSSATSSFSTGSFNCIAPRATFQTPASSFSSLSHGSTSGISLPWTGVSTTTSSIADTSCTSPSKSQGHMNPPDKTICHICGRGFKGKLGHRISNLNRHMRSVHYQGPSLNCTVPNCGRSFQRSDYLKKHYKSAHNIEHSPSDVNQYQAAHDESHDADTDNPSDVSWYEATPDENLDINIDNQETFLLPLDTI